LENRLCTICVRAGSKGLAGKNTRMLGGKPLMAYSILQARATGLFQEIAISSDSEDILAQARNWCVSCLIKRPASLATDEAPKIPVIQHALQRAEELTEKTFDVVVDLDATAPLRLVSDIVGVLELLENSGASNVISGTPSRRSPYFNMVELDEAGRIKLSKPLSRPLACRQESPICYDLNASIYAWQREALLRGNGIFFDDTRLYIMPAERSIDIDSALDFKLVAYLMRERGYSIE
jgi:CMP-N,N'-diacetyllegionaminic acid synthase